MRGLSYNSDGYYCVVPYAFYEETPHLSNLIFPQEATHFHAHFKEAGRECLIHLCHYVVYSIYPSRSIFLPSLPRSVTPGADLSRQHQLVSIAL